MSSRDSSPDENIFTKKKLKSSKQKPGQQDLEEAVPAHILRIVQGVEERRKKKNDLEKKRQAGETADSMSVFRKMMGSMRTKFDLDTAEDATALIEKENDIAKISNARDIFKTLDSHESQPRQAQNTEKHLRVEVKPDFLLEGQNKAEVMRRERLKEMAGVKAARERALEEEEMFTNNKQKSDEMKRQRETEIELMRMARQEALEEEERMEKMSRLEHARAVSPGLLAAKNVAVNRELPDQSQNKMEMMRAERARELEEMRRARDVMVEEDFAAGHDRSEASRELEAFRASRGGNIKERYNPDIQADNSQSRSQAFARAPKMKAKSNNWMKNASQDKMEEARIAREREMEMLMVARSQAIEEEELERAAEEQERRREAERKAHEMAVLVADLQRMRTQTARNAEEEAQMTRYQEEMLSRVMELHEIAKGGMMAN